MANIVKLQSNTWAFPSDGEGENRFYESGGTYPLIKYDGTYVSFMDGKSYYTYAKNALYMGPDTEKAVITSVVADEFGKAATIKIENKSNLTIRLIMSIDLEGEHREMEIADSAQDIIIPPDWIDIVKNSDSEYINFSLKSYNNGAFFGEDSKRIKINIPNDIVPIIDDVLLIPDNNKVPSDKGYFELIGKAKAYIKAHAVHNAEIIGTEITLNGISAKGLLSDREDYDYMCISETLLSGNNDINISVTDSRGRKATVLKQVRAQAYFFPRIENAKLVRANADGVEANEGEYAKVKGEIHVAEGFTPGLTLYENGKKCSRTGDLFGSFLIEKSYNLELVLSDGYFEGRYMLILESSNCLMNVTENAFAVGGYAKESGFEVFMPLASQIKEKIATVAGENILKASHTFDSTSYDDENLFSANFDIGQNIGILAWVNGDHDFYKAERQDEKLYIYANKDFKDKTINYILFKNSDFLEIVGLKEKNISLVIPTNEGNKENLIDWAYQGGSVSYKVDRAEARTNNNARNMLATKPIDLSQYSRVRIYGKLFTENGNSMYYVYFGVIKSEVIANPPGTNPNQAFYASRRLAGIDGYIELDISQINGMYSVGTYGIGDYDIYKFELLR